MWRVALYVASASACRPTRYSAVISSAARLSRNGWFAASSVSGPIARVGSMSTWWRETCLDGAEPLLHQTVHRRSQSGGVETGHGSTRPLRECSFYVTRIEQPLEPGDVDVCRIDREPVRRALTNDRSGTEALAEPGDVRLQSLLGGTGWVLAPDHLDDAGHRDDGSGSQGESRQYRLALRRPDVDGYAIVVTGANSAQESDLHHGRRQNPVGACGVYGDSRALISSSVSSTSSAATASAR